MGAALLLLTTPAQAENEDLEEGVRLYEALEYEPAQLKFEAALVHEEITKEELARTALYLGVVHVALGNPARGETWFTIALAYDGTLKVPDGTSPKIGEQFEALASRLTFTRPKAPEPTTVVVAPPPVDQPSVANTVPKQQERGIPLGTWIAGGGAVATSGLAITFGLMARSTSKDIEARPHGRAELAELQDTLDTRGALANAFVLATASLAATAGIIYLVDRFVVPTSSEAPAAIDVSATDSGATVGARFRF